MWTFEFIKPQKNRSKPVSTCEKLKRAPDESLPGLPGCLQKKKAFTILRCHAGSASLSLINDELWGTARRSRLNYEDGSGCSPLCWCLLFCRRRWEIGNISNQSRLIHHSAIGVLWLPVLNLPGPDPTSDHRRCIHQPLLRRESPGVNLVGSQTLPRWFFCRSVSWRFDAGKRLLPSVPLRQQGNGSNFASFCHLVPNSPWVYRGR